MFVIRRPIDLSYLLFCEDLVIVSVNFAEGFYAAWSSGYEQKLHLKDHRCICWYRTYCTIERFT